MDKATSGLAQITKDLFDLLEPLEPAERQRVISAALTLLGDIGFLPPSGGASAVHVDNGVARSNGHSAPSGLPASSFRAATGTPSNAQVYFEDKDPQSKLEEYAVAARFRELTCGQQTHSKEEFEQVITDARRNFNESKYRRDIDNAKTKGLFNRGDGNTLSAYGQKYVDALPDRDAARSVARPRTARRRRVSKGVKTRAKTKKA